MRPFGSPPRRPKASLRHRDTALARPGPAPSVRRCAAVLRARHKETRMAIATDALRSRRLKGMKAFWGGARESGGDFGDTRELIPAFGVAGSFQIRAGSLRPPAVN